MPSEPPCGDQPCPPVMHMPVSQCNIRGTVSHPRPAAYAKIGAFVAAELAKVLPAQKPGRQKALFEREPKPAGKGEDLGKNLYALW